MPSRRRERSLAVHSPNLGIYLDSPPLYLEPRALRDCLNVKIRNKAITRRNIGYGTFPEGGGTPINLDGLPVVMIDNFFPRAGGQFLLMANTRDLFLYRENVEDVVYLTPRYEVGTVGVTNGSPTVTGTATAWNDELKAGDQISIGDTGRIEQTDEWYEVLTVDSATQITLTENYAGSTDTGLDYTARSVFTGNADDYWETMLFFGGTNFTAGSGGDRWYGTNGRDPVVAWDGSEDQAYRPDLGDIVTCRTFAKSKNILMLVNLTLDTGELKPFTVATSAIGEPENHVTLEAARFVVHSGADPLVTSFSLGDSIVLYGERSITMTQFVGPPVMFVFRLAVDGVGPRSGRAIADFGDYHRFLGYDAQYDFNGIGIAEVNSHIWQEVIRTLSPQRFNLINSHFDEESGELFWVIPLNSDADPVDGGPEIAFVEHYLEDPGDVDFGDVHTKRQVPATAWGFFERVTTLTFDQLAEAWEDQNYSWNDQFFQAAFPFNLFGTMDGDIFVLGTRDSANGVPLRSFARFGRRQIGNIREKALVRRIYPMVETLQGAQHDIIVRIYGCEEPGGRAVLLHEEGYPMNQEGNHFLSPRIMSRYIELEFETTQAGEAWNLIGYDLDVVGGGER
jgi:hypothetical protein